MIVTICRQCGGERLAHVSEQRQFCSMSCRNAWLTARSERTFHERFWSRVQKAGVDECWLWQGARTGSGYGNFCLPNGKWRATHRILWELTSGSIPLGECVLHRCDNPPCCNPQHLFLGSLRDNAKDMVAKGRGRLWGGPRRGERNGRARLTAAQVTEARARYEGKYGDIIRLAREYGLGRDAMRRVLTGKTYSALDALK